MSNNSTWNLERTIRRTPSETTFHLGTGTLSGLACALRITSQPEGRFHVRAAFAHGREPHAKAEAARFYAMVLDTIGDLAADGETEDGLAVDADPSLLGTTVELSGPDAAIAAIAFFGGNFGAGNAADAITDALAG